MSGKFYSKRNLDFMLYEVFNVEDLTQYPYFKDHNREIFEMILDTTDKFAKNRLRPLLSEMDRQKPHLEEGTIKVHPEVKGIMRDFGAGGWISACSPYEWDGQQLPFMVSQSAEFIFGAANFSASAYPFLSMGSSNLLLSFASEELKKEFIPKMYSGEWQGTMALTEPDAGSSLSDLVTSAEPTDEGHYLIDGQKIFISCGDHDGCENIVHLLLARIKGAPQGTKGISLFVVPKKRKDAEGNLVANDVRTEGVYHKMGYHGAPIAHLMYGTEGDCHGYLIGQANRGLIYMFQMMNEARIAVGLMATGIASAAYYASLEYAMERPQGRPIANKSLDQDQVPIIQHADVKRMLLFQKAIVEGSLALVMRCSRLSDLVKAADRETADKAHLLLDLLTPIVKTYPSEMGCHSTSTAVQCLGGYGYIQDFPVEQYFREARIHPIHEGTTGIQGIDLLGRKLFLHEGKGMALLHAEVTKTLSAAVVHQDLKPQVERFSKYMEKLQTVTLHLTGVMEKEGTEAFLADATLYLELFGILVIGWHWLEMAVVAKKGLQKDNLTSTDKSFYQGKLHALRYFFEYEMVKCEGLALRLMSLDRVTVEVSELD